jgi:2-phospho-L-lactate guanylyltransferase
MKIWAIVPVKRLSAAKSRLAPALPLRRRRELVCSLLARTLIALRDADGIEGTIVAGRDRTVAKIAAEFGAVFIRDHERDGLNRALARAQKEAVRRGAEAVLVLPADLPFLTSADVARALPRSGKNPQLTIAPDRTEHGTNLLLMAPPQLIRFSFGERSFRRHVLAARRAGARIKVIRRPSLAQDLDCPADLARCAKFSIQMKPLRNGVR